MENKRYVYGYQNGWNVENEYLNKIDSYLEDYNNQKQEIERVVSERKQVLAEIEKNSREVSDEELRRFQEEDQSSLFL